MRNKPKIADHSALQISIALNRARQFNVPIENLHPQTLSASFLQVRKLLFCDFLESPNLSLQPVLTSIFAEFEQAISSKADISLTLASLFTSLNALKAFNFGNNITVRKFMHDLSITLHRMKVIPRVLDFRYTSEQLYHKHEAAPQFNHMLTSKDVIKFDEDIQEWPPLPNASVTIGGFRYLTYNDNFLVTLNGGLIELETAAITLEKSIKRTGNPSDFTVNRSAIAGYLFNHNNPISTLDGLTFGDEVPLMCLDVDHLTGLPMDDKFENFVYLLNWRGLSALDMPNYDNIDDRVRARVSRLHSYINIVKRRFFKDIKPATNNPKFFLSMGGIGSGKSSLIDHITTHAGSNFVTSSIDKARACSKLLDFYMKCAHHSDDYQSLKLFARCLVNEITKDVIAGRYHYFRDSSGIPFAKDNADEITLFKGLGYETNVYSASASLYAEKDRKDLGKPAHTRVMKRYRKKHRAVPWEIVIAKHVGHPDAFLDAMRYKDLDNLKIFDTTGKKGHKKLLACSKDISIDNARKLAWGRSISKGQLLYQLTSLNIIDEDDIPKEFQLKRLDYFECASFDKNSLRIMLIYDIVKFIDLMQKGNLYPDAKGYDELVFNSNQIHIPEIDYPYDKRHNECAWRLRNQIITNDDYLL